MKNKSVFIPMGMVTKKFYCHRCGERLGKHAQTRTVTPNDPDYKKHSRMSHKYRIVGNIEVTGYDFQCSGCGNRIEYDEQCVIEKIQHRLNKTHLTDEEILHNRKSAEENIKRNRRILKVISAVIGLAVLALIFYFKYKSGDFSISLHF